MSRSVLLFIDLILRDRRPWEAWLLGLARALKQEGRHLVLVVPGEAPAWFLEEFRAAGGVLECAPAMRGSFHASTAMDLVRRHRPETLLLCFYPMLQAGVLGVVRRSGARQAYYVDQSSLPLPRRAWPASHLVWLRTQVGIRAYRKVITVSGFSAERLRTRLYIPGARLVTIPNGVPLERFTDRPVPPPGNDAPFFYAGQVAEYKGVRTLVAAYERLRSVRAGVPPLLVAGQGPLLAELAREASTRASAASIRFLGQVPDVPERMMSALCSIVPSEWDEACSFASLEAMAAGRPVILSDAGSLPELFAGLGRTFPRGDVAALAFAMAEVLEASEADRAKAGALLHARALERFSTDTMVEGYLRVLRAGWQDGRDG